MRFKGLDLNLLVALDMLLTEQNVSRAAERLFLSQSATSGALARLREYFNDDLLVQVGRKMVLTARGQVLSAKVRAALMQIDSSIIQPQDFDPSTDDRTIRIVASDYVVMAELAAAVREIHRQAPGMTIILDPPGEEPAEELARGQVDLLAMPEVYIASDHPSVEYFTDEYVVLFWEGNDRIGDTMTKEQFFESRHVSMRFARHMPSFETWFMKYSGEERNVAAVAGSFTALPFLLEGTENIALIQGRLARIFADRLPLRVVPSPVHIPPLVEHLQWNSFAIGDVGLDWVRRVILDSRDAALQVL